MKRLIDGRNGRRRGRPLLALSRRRERGPEESRPAFWGGWWRPRPLAGEGRGEGRWIGVLLALCLVWPAFGDWPSFRGDAALTGVATGELPAALSPLWTFEAGDGIESTAAVVNGVVYVGSLDGNLYALELATGKLKFKVETGQEIKSSPTVFAGTVYFGEEGGTFHAVDAQTGAERWTFKTDAGITSSATVLKTREGAVRVLFGSYDGFLYCLDGDGKLVWKLETDNYVHATPAVADGKVYIAGCDGLLRAIALTDGKEVARVSLGGYAAASPALSGARAYVGTFENQVLAVDLTAGKTLWTYEHAVRKFPYYASAAVYRDTVVVAGRDKLVRALDAATGRERWVLETPARVDASPVLVGDRVLAGSMSGDLYALELATGKIAWQYATGSSFSASPAVADGKVVIGTADGLVYAFGAAQQGGAAQKGGASPKGNSP